MGEIILFNPNKQPKPKVSDLRYHGAIRSDNTRQATQNAIGDLIRKPSFTLPDIQAKIVQPQKEPGEQGTCFVYTPRGDGVPPFLVTSSLFPNFLISQGMSTDEAVNVAAIYARGLDFMHHALSGRKTWHGGEKQAIQRVMRAPSRTAYWGEQFNRSALQIEFRAAGAIALEATGIDVDVDIRPPFDPHIAGLVDPLVAPKPNGALASGSFLELQEIVTYTIQ
jgi:hypothetical protein